MNSAKKSILGVDVSTNTKDELLQEVSDYLKKKSKTSFTIVTPNPEQMVYTQKDARFRKILNSADIALPDGIGIVWAMNRLKNNAPQPPLSKRGSVSGGVIKRIPGIEFAEELIKIAAQNNYHVGLVGGRINIAQKALERLQKKYPKLNGWAEDGPEIKISNLKSQISSEETPLEELQKKIKRTNTRLLFIGFGAPKQEFFIEAISHQPSAIRQNVVLMVVGGSFDVWSGRIRRAPLFIRGLGFEWLWRLFQEPWRIKRQLNLLKFIYLVLKK